MCRSDARRRLLLDDWLLEVLGEKVRRQKKNSKERSQGNIMPEPSVGRVRQAAPLCDRSLGPESSCRGLEGVRELAPQACDEVLPRPELFRMAHSAKAHARRRWEARNEGPVEER